MEVLELAATKMAGLDSTMMEMHRGSHRGVHVGGTESPRMTPAMPFF
jgi:hypothetical protein